MAPWRFVLDTPSSLDVLYMIQTGGTTTSRRLITCVHDLVCPPSEVHAVYEPVFYWNVRLVYRILIHPARGNTPRNSDLSFLGDEGQPNRYYTEGKLHSQISSLLPHTPLRLLHRLHLLSLTPTPPQLRPRRSRSRVPRGRRPPPRPLQIRE